MAKVIWTEPALQDLNDIAEYIALDKVSAAKEMVKKVFSAVENLEMFPLSGRKPPELGESRYLELIINPCRVFYRVEEEKVFILFVMRSERELRKYLLGARFRGNYS